MKIDTGNVRGSVYRLTGRGAKKPGWILFALTLCAAIFAVPALRSQIPQALQKVPPNQNVYGTYNIQTNGEAAVTTHSDQNSKIVRDEWEKSSWQLTYYKVGTADMLKTHVLAWTHELVYIQTFSTGPVGKTTTSTKTEYAYDENPVTSTLAIGYFTQASGPPYRKLLMNEADCYVKTTMTITNYDRNNKVIPGDSLHPNPDIRPRPGAPYNADFLRMHLDLPGWPDAKWATDYQGSITALNNYSTYIAPAPSGEHWLTVNAQWNLHP
jgi:hypothetical protein